MSGNFPDSREALHIVAKTGAGTSTEHLTNQVGTESRTQCLVDMIVTIRRISSGLTGWKAAMDEVMRALMTGLAALAVTVRIRSTLDTKCDERSSAESWLWWPNDGTDSRRWTFVHRALGSLRHSLMVVSQYCRNLSWNICRCWLNCVRHRSLSWWLRKSIVDTSLASLLYICTTDAVFSEVHDQWESRERRV